MDPESNKMVKARFVDKWLDDPNKRSVEKLVIDPENKAQDNVYNMWPGFLAARLPPVDPERIPELTQPIVRHIYDVYANKNQTHANWLMAHSAHMFQHPGTKTNVAVSLYGDEGCGKGIILEFYRNDLMGPDCTYQTSNIEEDVLGKFAKALVGTVLVQIDENRSTHKNADRLKDIITNATVNYQAKNKDTIVLPSLANLFFTSNNANTIAVSQTDRRYALFQCSNIYRGNQEYFKDLSDHLRIPEVASACYTMFMEADITGFGSLQATRPKTEYYLEMQRANMPIVHRYLSALVNSRPPTIMYSKEMFEQCIKMAEAGRYSFHMNASTFGKRVQDVLGEKAAVHSKKGNQYHIDSEDIKRRLIMINGYDLDATLFPSTGTSSRLPGRDVQDDMADNDTVAVTYHIPVV